jgi:hypothetical protein
MWIKLYVCSCLLFPITSPEESVKHHVCDYHAQSAILWENRSGNIRRLLA